MNAPIQLAASVLLDQRKSLQPLLLDRLRLNLSQLDRELARQKTCHRMHIEGGWYAVLRVPVTQSDEELAVELLRKGSLLVHPGHFYDFPTDGYLVVSLMTPSQPFHEGIARMLDLVNG
jgi:aspartate/methionine/tyrosine aminotransferase